ncbi:hypothetical protein QUC31_001339 [Theobroma cacao]
MSHTFSYHPNNPWTPKETTPTNDRNSKNAWHSLHNNTNSNSSSLRKQPFVLCCVVFPVVLPPHPLLKMRTLLTLGPPCLSSSSSSSSLPITYNSHSSPSSCSSSNSFLYSFRPNKRFHFVKPCSSLKQTKKQQSLQRSPPSAPQSLRWFLNPQGDDDKKLKVDADADGNGEGGIEGGSALTGTLLAGVLLFGVVGGLGTVGFIYKDQINAFLNQFSTFIEGYGPAGYALFVAVYAGLEVLAIPAIPLTMSAGLLFGSVIGTIIVSISGTVAASVAFLIARYFARERILKLVEGNKKFLAIDKAIGENGFRVVTLLRLSPLLPFSLGNYLYGLTSVKFVPYVLGSWLGMLPGTWAYVSAGAFGRAIIVSFSFFFNFVLLLIYLKFSMISI